MNTNRITTTIAAILLLAASAAAADRYPNSEKVEQVPDYRTEKIREVPDHPGPGYPVDVEIWINRGDGARFYEGERIEIYFRTNVDAWVEIFDIDTRRRVHRLFPSHHAPNNFVRGGEVHRVPARYGYHFEVEGPSGWETLRAVASTDRCALSHHRHDRPGHYRNGYKDGGEHHYPATNKIREVSDGPRPSPYLAVDETRHYVKEHYRPRRP